MEDRNCRRQQKVRGDAEKLERKEMGRRSETHQLRISFSGHVCARHTRNLTPVALWSRYFVQKAKAKRNKNRIKPPGSVLIRTMSVYSCIQPLFRGRKLFLDWHDPQILCVRVKRVVVLLFKFG